MKAAQATYELLVALAAFIVGVGVVALALAIAIAGFSAMPALAVVAVVVGIVVLLTLHRFRPSGSTMPASALAGARRFRGWVSSNR